MDMLAKMLKVKPLVCFQNGWLKIVLDFYPNGLGREPYDRRVSFTIILMNVIQLKNKTLKMNFNYGYMLWNLVLVFETNLALRKLTI